MQVQITITNPSFDALLALAMAMHGTTTFGVSYDAEGGEVRQDDAPTTAQGAVAESDAPECFTWLKVGDLVHWRGQLFNFDGVVERFEPSDDHDAKVVWVRRDDTGKLVSLTLSDLQTGSLGKRIPSADPKRVTTLNEIDMYLDVGIRVHWKGAKFEFDGTVEDFDTYEVRDDDFDAKVVYLRRDDTGTKVSLTLRDLQTGSLTLR